MYTILLTDDEPIVTDSLSFIIERNFPGQTTVLKALSGSEAINFSRTHKIDIYFMDINMPGLNGLEAISEIKKINPSSVIIILSAFDRFQYAQEALALGAYRYLTKPVNQNVLTQTIRNAMSMIDSFRGKLSSDIEIKEKLSFVSSIVESDFIFSSVFSKEDGKSLKSYLDYFKITEDSYFFFCIEFVALSSDKRYETYMKVRDLIASHSNAIIGPFMSGRIAVYVPFVKTADEISDSMKQREFIRHLYSAMSLKIQCKIRCGAGFIYSDLEKTLPAYNSALSALNVVPPDGGLDFAENVAIKQKPDGASVSRQEQRLISRVMAGDVPGTRNQTTIWLKELIDFEDSLDSVKSNVFRVLLNARMCASEAHKGYATKAIFNTSFALINNCSTYEEFSNYILPQITECASLLCESNNAKQNPVILRVKEYIEEHIATEISLETVADFVSVNPVYLSKLFKDETGENFIDFVTGLRLEKACALLVSSELSIKEISHKTGYSDQNYFSKLFRRKFNLTPTEYRNSRM